MILCIFVMFTIERHFLVYWPEEDCYSEVPQSKVVGEPTDTIQVKERGKIYVGQLKGVGSKQEIQQKLNSILGESSQPTVTPSKPKESKTSQEKGTSYYKLICVIYTYRP